MSDQQNQSGEKAGQGPEDAGKGTSGPGFRQRLEEFEKTLRQSVLDAEQAVRSGIKSALPPDAHKHLSNTKREFLLFVRSIVDAELQRSEQDKDREQPGKQTPPEK